MRSRGIFQRIVKLSIVFIITTLLLMLHLSKQSSDENTAVLTKKYQIMEDLRLERIRDLQQTIFSHPKRPPDEKYNINVTLSEHIPLERDIRDTRPNACKTIKYDLSKYPKITVIIPFYNEALSMLLRTVHSIINRTPAQLLEEIILINDHSPNEDLGEPLERYVRYLSKVKLIRTTQREGLIRVRMIGAGMAKGEVLMFQDAHTENNVQWAEPLLEEIRKNPSTVIQPQVDGIDQYTINYEGSAGVVPRGGFTWDLRYVWMQMPAHEKRRMKYPGQPHRTPTLVGCALAVRRDYFLAIGGFDDGMNVWGGENIELAFRTWLCGGQVLNHPCSRVGHVFKPFSYSFDGDREKIVQKNLMRIAELWMDDYKRFFLAATYTWEFKRTYLNEDELRTLEKRRNMKKNLKCKSFDWYMQNIVPEVPTPPDNAVYYGEVASRRSEACLELKDDGYVGMTYFCFFHRLLPQNIFHIDQDGRLWHADKCIRLEKSSWLIRTGECLKDTSKEKWDVIASNFYEGQIRVTFEDEKDQPQKSMCVTQVTNVNKQHYRDQMPQLMHCDEGNEFQSWRWQYKFDFNYNFDPPSVETL